MLGIVCPFYILVPPGQPLPNFNRLAEWNRGDAPGGRVSNGQHDQRLVLAPCPGSPGRVMLPDCLRNVSAHFCFPCARRSPLRPRVACCPTAEDRKSTRLNSSHLG